MTDARPSERPTRAELWEAFRAALNELHRVDPERARLYLQGAAGALRGYAQSVQAAGKGRRG